MKFLFCFPLFLFVLSGMVLIVCLPGHAAWEKDAPLCEINSEPCLQKIGNAEVSLIISPRPVKALEELTLTVILKGVKDPGKLLIEFSMPGMYMGENHSILTRKEPGIYTGRGVIPKCPSGKNFWKVSVLIPGSGSADFFFHVLY